MILQTKPETGVHHIDVTDADLPDEIRGLGIVELEIVFSVTGHYDSRWIDEPIEDGRSLIEINAYDEHDYIPIPEAIQHILFAKYHDQINAKRLIVERGGSSRSPVKPGRISKRRRQRFSRRCGFMKRAAI